jgi:iron complex outermembrane receptor protein
VPAALALITALVTLQAAAQTPPADVPPPAPTPAPAASPAPAPAPAATDAPAPRPGVQQIQITGGRQSDTEQRRQATAAKIVIGREEIDRFGDATLGEVLRRLPGVTVPGGAGRGGPPRMRGLGGGFTQLLIDGQRVPPGFSLESLPPDQVERIEILRAPTAETGARAIAGTINIITREGFRRRLNDLRVSLASENGRVTPRVFWTHNDSAGALTYNLNAGTFRNRRSDSSVSSITETDLADGSLLREEVGTGQTEAVRLGLNLGARLQWRLGEAGDMLMLNPSVFHSSNDSRSSGTRTLLFTDSPLSGPRAQTPYDTVQSQSDSSFTNLRLQTQWRQRLSPSTRLELSGSGGSWRARNDIRREEVLASRPQARVIKEAPRTRERSLNLTTKLSSTLGGDPGRPGSEHSLVSGLELEGVRRSETRGYLIDGDSPYPAGFRDELQASTLRVAAYVQDEWAVTPQWAVHGGLRWEGISTRGDAAQADADDPRPSNRSSVWTPLVHVLFKPDPAKRDQVRLSLTRSYRSPGVSQLIARPSINNQTPLGQQSQPTSPDSIGNPDLQPELATGVDLAFERYLAGGGVLSVNLFHRRITDLVRNVVRERNVSYSNQMRFVSQPQNIGNASTQGIELEARFRLDQVMAGAPPVELRSNLSLYRSRVDDVPGPDNRLDQQAAGTANIGADYRVRGTPFTLGGTLNVVPGYRTQQAADRATTINRNRVFDAYALWAVNPGLSLRVTASNLAPTDVENSNSVDIVRDDRKLRETRRSVSASSTNWQLRAEFKL